MRNRQSSRPDNMTFCSGRNRQRSCPNNRSFGRRVSRGIIDNRNQGRWDRCDAWELPIGGAVEGVSVTGVGVGLPVGAAVEGASVGDGVGAEVVGDSVGCSEGDLLGGSVGFERKRE